MNEIYKRQVGLLLDVLPEVAKEACFALHGGTAINLFVRDMPRLSVRLKGTEGIKFIQSLISTNMDIHRRKIKKSH